jgi:hypothetical protein
MILDQFKNKTQHYESTPYKFGIFFLNKKEEEHVWTIPFEIDNGKPNTINWNIKPL